MSNNVLIASTFLLGVYSLFHARRGLVFNRFHQPPVTAKMSRLQRVMWFAIGAWFMIAALVLLLRVGAEL